MRHTDDNHDLQLKGFHLMEMQPVLCRMIQSLLKGKTNGMQSPKSSKKAANSVWK